ncbi:AMP-binding protein [Streptomyces sp. DSM 40750]|uniref:AMP-binding protein n=1 Tax=Streptomyces sp. DSM 40750 TaxID=2801030 RepID=UPI00214CDA33|nr:AMP-binding protein [Streptomyces sp. DSM 40750]UUU19617.1 AMP-binding protein [Streptomyces sp. DSM 40750]UUU27041.1 AMP-binding protein [Streptomyces sp. DSM 40750]
MSFASPHADVELSDLGLHEFLFAGLSPADLERVALVSAESGESLTYGSLKTRVDGFAAELVTRGIGPGDAVALLCPNTPAFAIAFHGILRAGATVTTVNLLSTAAEIARQLSAARAQTLVTVTAFASAAQEATGVAGLDAAAILLLDAERPPASALAIDPVPAPDRFDPAERVAVLPFSSGTTGVPKGVMLTHRNLVANIAQLAPVLDLRSDDVVLAALPFFHIYGMTALLNSTLAARGRIVTMARFDLKAFLEAIQRHRVTYLYIAPPIAVALAKHPLVDSYDLTSLRAIVSGAAPLDEELGAAVSRRLSVPVVQGYGMTELSPVSHIVPVADGGVAIAGRRAPIAASGWPVPNTVDKLVDPATGAEIDVPAEGLSEPGELWVRGPNVMAGYLGNPEATAATVDADGFLHTGDLARVDSTGCVYIVDRIKELIKYKGYQVAPAELEALLLTHPDIVDAAVIGVVDAEGEEIPKAFVVTGNSALSAEQVMEFLAAQVAPYKKVRDVEFIAAIPKSSAGKILRKELRAGGRGHGRASAGHSPVGE